MHRYPCQSAQHLRSHHGLASGTSSTSRSSLSTMHGDTCCVSGAKFGVANSIGGYVSSLESSSPGKPWCEDCQSSEFATTLVLQENLQDTVQQVFVENFRTLGLTKDANWKDLFEATPKLVRSWNSWSQNVVTVMEMKSRSLLWWKKGYNLGWSSASMSTTCVRTKNRTTSIVFIFCRRFYRSNNESGMIYIPLMTTIAETFQTRWHFFTTLWWFLRRSRGERCNAGSIAQTPNWKSGRSRYGLNHQERGSNKQRCVWNETEIFCVCVLSDASMKEINLVYHCRTMYQSRTFRLNTFNTSVLRFLANFLINQVWFLEEKMWKKGDEPCFSLWCPWTNSFTTWKSLERYFHELTGMCTRILFFFLEQSRCSKQRTDIWAIEFQCHHPQQLCASQLSWKSGKMSRPVKFWINGFVIATSATKVTRQSVWQVRRESTAKHVADKVTTRPKVGVRFPGLPRNNTSKIVGNKTLEDLCMQLCLIQTDTFIDCWIAK